MSRRAWLAVPLLIITLALAACNTLSPNAPTGSGPGVDLSDPEVGGGAGQESGPETPLPPATPTRDPSPRLDATGEAVATFPAASPTPAPTVEPPTATPAVELPTATIAPAVETPTATAPEPSPPTEETAPPGETIHVVQAGENLYRIGLRYGLSWVVIAEYNGITDPNAITVGQEIRIPPAPTATPETTSATGQSIAAAPDQPEPPAGPTGDETSADPSLPGDPPATGEPPDVTVVVVAVTPGDTLYSISRRYGISWDQLAEANGLTTPNQIYAGQVLKIPADAPGPAHEFSHRVRSGDTLSGIARQYGLSLEELAAANGLSAPYVIYPGQIVTIPASDPE